jgi:hypothetical protein
LNFMNLLIRTWFEYSRVYDDINIKTSMNIRK